MQNKPQFRWRLGLRIVFVKTVKFEIFSAICVTARLQILSVFIGGPVWWGTYPQVMFTLFRDINLDGKTVIPFTTHEGSGLASCASDIRKAFPKAKVTGEFSIYGHEVRSGRAKVEKWLKGLGY